VVVPFQIGGCFTRQVRRQRGRRAAVLGGQCSANDARIRRGRVGRRVERRHERAAPATNRCRGGAAARADERHRRAVGADAHRDRYGRDAATAAAAAALHGHRRTRAAAAAAAAATLYHAHGRARRDRRGDGGRWEFVRVGVALDGEAIELLGEMHNLRA